jgi:hypothetical protein
MDSSLRKAIILLERWNEVEIPSHIWTNPGEDYTLPLDTQEFLENQRREVK